MPNSDPSVSSIVGANPGGFAALGGFTLFLIAIGVLLYFVPAVIAWKRNHPQKTPIIALNILLGWSVLGWIASLIWSLTTPQAPQQIVINNIEQKDKS